ncbi:MAG TPA: DUF6316 family protein [Pseudomonadales bacterium]|nr:DUF6316 family protein [Pseudomonadales bacterium]
MSHAPYRRDEAPGRHLRSDRCMLRRGRWYIATREGIDVGPYESRETAERDARLLVMMLDAVDDPKAAHAFISEFQRRAHAPNKRAATSPKRRLDQLR